jgi:hypothetical protein
MVVVQVLHTPFAPHVCVPVQLFGGAPTKQVRSCPNREALQLHVPPQGAHSLSVPTCVHW